MCGIVGAVQWSQSAAPLDEATLIRMRDTLSHRGPDGAGIWMSEDRRIGLGHRRLSIIDLSTAAAQPMSNEDGSLWVVFNGEIYNHAEVRRDLERTGHHRWRTDHSDTEVILHAFEEWGIDCLERFRGMFAIALWETRSKTLWLIRDRIGIKPLYYSRQQGRLTFASEIKAILADPRQPRAVNSRALYHYLTFLTTPAPQTMFDGISKLPAGCWLKIDAQGRETLTRYWEVWDRVEPMTTLDEHELQGRILDELRTAVRLRKVSDVPVGVFLSGGVDSSTNAMLFAEDQSQAVKTFTIGYDAPYASYPSECPQARQMAERIGAEHHERLVTLDDLLAFLPEMARLQDEPLADPVCVPVYYVSQLARQQGVIVCQAGEGADELFCGYPQWRRFLQLDRANRLPVPHFMKRAGLRALALAGKGGSPYYEWLRRGADDQPIFWGGAEVFTEHEKQQLVSTQLRRELGEISSFEVIEPIRQRFLQAAWEPSALHWMTYLDLQLRLPELLLMRIDKMSMGVGLEARVPFLDHKFVELVLGIPTAAKLCDGQLKYLLKETVRPLVGSEVVDRPKQGFGVPILEWCIDRLGTRARSEIERMCRETGWFEPSAVEALFARRQWQHVWSLLNLSLWWQAHWN